MCQAVSLAWQHLHQWVRVRAALDCERGILYRAFRGYPTSGMQVTVAHVRAGPHGTTLERQPGSGAAEDASYLYNFVQSRALEAAEGGCRHLAAVAGLLCEGAARASAGWCGV